MSIASDFPDDEFQCEACNCKFRITNSDAPARFCPLCGAQLKDQQEILDYGKFKYDRKRRSKKTTEIRFRIKTGKHDTEFKVKRAIALLQSKAEVLICVQFRGREKAHIEEGRRVMEKIVKAIVPEHGEMKSPIELQPRRLVCTIAPK